MTMEIKTIEVIPGENYDVHLQDYYWGGDEPTRVRAAFTKNGHYIGDEKTADYLTGELGLTDLQPADPKCNVCSIGFNEKTQKWAGWSHRALYQFGVGSTVKPGDCAFKPSNMLEWIHQALAWHKDNSSDWSMGDIESFSWDSDSNTLTIKKKNSDLEAKEKFEPEHLGGGEWTAKTLEDAKRMARDFAESVSSDFEALCCLSNRFNPVISRQLRVRKVKVNLMVSTSSDVDTFKNEKATTAHTVTISGEPEKVNRVLALLAMIQFNGHVGHSGIFGISWDGDGSDKIDIDGLKQVFIDNKDGINACTSYGGYVEFVGESGNFFVGSGKDLNTKKVWPKEEQ